MYEDKIILGLDISTNTIGISLYQTDKIDWHSKGKLILIEGLILKSKEINKIKGIEALFLKKKIFEEKLKEIKLLVKTTYNKNIDYVVIETPLIQSNNAHTIAVLLQFNGIISNVIYEDLGIVPEYITSYDARYYSFPELVAIHVFNKKNERRDYKEIKKCIIKNKIVLFGNYPFQIDKKQVILEKVSEKFPDIEWKENKKGDILKSSFDGSDSIACVLGWLNKMFYNEAKLEIVDCEYDEYERYIKYTTSFKGQDSWEQRINFDFATVVFPKINRV